MLLNDWIKQYGTREMITPSDPQKCLNEFSNIFTGGGNKRVYFYGGGAVGNTFVSIFSQLGIKIDGVFDRAYETRKVAGCEMYPPEKIVELLGENDVLIGTVNWRNQDVIQKYLKKLGVQNELVDGSLLHSPLQRSICTLHNIHNKRMNYADCSCCFIESSRCDIMRKNVIQSKNGAKINHGKSKLPLIEVIVGNVCTLRCDKCLESVPYTKLARHQESKEKLIGEIKRVSEAIEFATTVNFLGGEPFLHPDLPDIIDAVSKIPNVGIVKLITNGTVNPSARLVESLKNDFVLVNVSDYSSQLSNIQKARIAETLRILKNEGIAFSHIKDMTWYDMSSFQKNDDDDTALRNRFQDCRMNGSHRMYDNKVFPCSHFYAGYVSGQLPLDDTVIDIFEDDITLLAKRLDQLWEQPYSTACRYCNMPYVSRLVPGGAQVSK